MHIPVLINITCIEDNVDKIKGHLLPNKLIHIREISKIAKVTKDISKTYGQNVKLNISGIVFDHEDISIIEKDLRHYGDTNLIEGKVRFFTLNNMLSALIVAGIVFIVLSSHNFNEGFFQEVIEKHNFSILGYNLVVATLSASVGFFLELLIMYRERRIIHHL